MKDLNMRALVVMSGGQDSATCLAVALNTCGHVEALSFDYGQKHKVELSMARRICTENDVPHTVIELASILQQMKSSGLVTGGDTSAPHPYIPGVAASFVPVRNAIFLTTAYGVAMERGMTHLVTGVCQADASGYPDCRDDFIRALNVALDVGYNSDIAIITPLMFLSKAETFALADKLGWLDTIIHDTLTCYAGDVTTKHPWGYGCGECGSCREREKGWNEFQATLAVDA